VLVDGPYGRPPSVNSFSSVVLLAGGSGVSFTLPLLLDIISAVGRHKSPVRRVLFVWSVKHRGGSRSLIGYYLWSNVLLCSIDDVKWAYDDIQAALKNLPPKLSIDVRIHITRTSTLVPAADAGDDAMAMDKRGLSLYPVVSGPSKVIAEVVPALPVDGIHDCLGRADLLALVREEVESAEGPVSVNGQHYSGSSLPVSPVNGLTYPVRGTASGPLPFTNAVRAVCKAEFAGPMAVLRGAPPLTLYTERFGAIKG